MITFSLVWIYECFLRPILKWFLRKTTGLCELQRICYGEVSGAPRIKSVEYSLNKSKSSQIKQLITHLDELSRGRCFTGSNERNILKGAIGIVLTVKKINPRVHEQFVKSFGKCVEQIWGYKQLISEVEELRRTAYDSTNWQHEDKLFQLWNALKPDKMLEGRITKQWQEIGFQGDDPKTDFRGMGMLGLENLYFFSTEYRTPAQHVLLHSHHPNYGYCFAIVGINLTSLAWMLLKDGTAKTYMYNTSKSLPSMRHFHQFFCYLFYEFDRYWMECKPKDIMEFSNIKTKFENNIRVHLQDPNLTFKIGVSVDNV